MVKVKVLLVDEHAMVRDGLQMILHTQSDMKVVAGLSDAQSAVEAVEALRPDVVVMDFSPAKMNGIEAISNMLVRFPALKIIILTRYDLPDYVAKAFMTGASGFLLKKSSSIELIKAIREVIIGKRYLGQGVEELLSVGMFDIAEDPYETLSSREKQILMMVVNGKASEEISDTLFLSRKSVETYRSRIFGKLGIDHNIPSLVKFAVSRGLVHQ